MKRKRGIFITGSGKCGTSVIAHSFHAAGFPMGRMSDLVIHEGAKGNIRGYWEHSGVVGIDRKVLSHNQADWDVLPVSLPLQLSDGLRREMAELAATLPDGFCCKDPRLVWTVDLWSEWFPDLVVIAAFRNPAGFRRSIAHVWPDHFAATGNGESSPEFAIWESTNRRLLELAQRFPVYWICFDDPAPVMKRRLREIMGRLGRTFDPAAFDAFFVPDERRFSSETDIRDSLERLPETVTELYRELQERARADDGLPEASPSPTPNTGPATSPDAALLYLDLLKRCLTRTLFPDGSIMPGFAPTPGEFVAHKRLEGLDWPTEAETMIGLKRLDNIQHCIREVLVRGVDGDLVEAGVWRGGAAIFMRAVLAAYGDTRRRVWLADSFQGLPQPDPANYPDDAGDRHWELTPYLGIPVDVVCGNFERYGLLDDQVRFLPGWFKDTLPDAPIDRIAVLRIDGDMYESTYEALTFLYPRLAPGGYVIIDDYNALPNCKAAVDDYRHANAVDAPIQGVDWTGVYWLKP